VTARRRWAVAAAAVLVIVVGAVALAVFLPDPPVPADTRHAVVLDPAACSAEPEPPAAAALVELDRRTGALTEVCGPTRADELARLSATSEPADPIDLLGLEPLDPDDPSTGTLVPLEPGTGGGTD
jgi:hypothetical protein